MNREQFGYIRIGRPIFLFGFLLTTLLSLHTVVLAEPVNTIERGLEIAKEMKSRDRGWGDSQSQMVMVLRDAAGNSVERKLNVSTLEMRDDGDKSLTVFESPLDVKGTSFLSFSHALEPDEQWIFLPALKRVKRIASRSKSGPFVASEFAFEDMSSFEVPKYTYELLAEEKYQDHDVFIVKHIPQYEYSGYSYQKVWIDKAEYIVRKIEYYDRKQALLKTLELKEYRQYLDKFWRPHRSEMVNHQTGKSTTLMTRKIAFKTGLTERDFDQNSLRRAR